MFRKREDPFDGTELAEEGSPGTYLKGKYVPKHAKPKQKKPKKNISPGWLIFERSVQAALVALVISIALLFVFGYLKK